MKKPPIFYFIYREGLVTVTFAQVLRPLNILVKRGYEVSVLLMTPLGEFLRLAGVRRWRANRSLVRRIYTGAISRIPSPPSRMRALWDERLGVRLWARRALKDEAAIIHCRGAAAVALLNPVVKSRKNVRMVYDCRGADEAEYLYLRQSPIAERTEAELREARRLRRIHEEAVREADAIICVSNAMRRWLVREVSGAKEKITIIPCCVDKDAYRDVDRYRGEARASMGLENKYVVTYCGNLMAWQLPGHSLDVFKRVQDVEPSAHFIGLTSQPEAFRKMARERGISDSDATIMHVPYDEVPYYLSASDVGLLLRESSLVNEVAAPVKFAEYLACGVPVIISEGVGDYSDVVANSKAGVVLRGQGDDETLNALRAFTGSSPDQRAQLRERCKEICAEQFMWNVHLPALENVYQHLHVGMTN